VLWGESASDVQLSIMLNAARAAFTQISLAFPDVFWQTQTRRMPVSCHGTQASDIKKPC
jgi:hypothetical protein